MNPNLIGFVGLVAQLASSPSPTDANSLPEPGCLNVATNFPKSQDSSIANRIEFSENLETDINEILQHSTTEIEHGKLSKIRITKSEQSNLEVKGDNFLNTNLLKLIDEGGYLLHKGHVTVNFLPVKLRVGRSVISAKKDRHGNVEIYVIISTVGTRIDEFPLLTLASIVRAFQLSVESSDSFEFFSNISSILTPTSKGRYTFTKQAVKTTAKFFRDNKLLECPKPEVSTILTDITTTESLPETAPLLNALPTPATKTVITKSPYGKLNCWFLVIAVLVLLLLIFLICIGVLFCRCLSGSTSRSKSSRRKPKTAGSELEAVPFPVEKENEAELNDSDTENGDSGVETASRFNRSLATSRATSWTTFQEESEV